MIEMRKRERRAHGAGRRAVMALQRLDWLARVSHQRLPKLGRVPLAEDGYWQDACIVPFCRGELLTVSVLVAQDDTGTWEARRTVIRRQHGRPLCLLRVGRSQWKLEQKADAATFLQTPNAAAATLDRDT